MTTWRERIRDRLSLTSPSGAAFEAKWIGDQRSTTKKLAAFDYPKVAGTIVQDLDVISTSWPLTFFFDGGDHDLESEKFWNASLENGVWAVVHPVYGFKALQLTNITEHIQPVKNGNIRRFETQWMEPIDPKTLKTSAEMAGAIGVQADLMDINAADQFVDELDIDDDFSIIAAIDSVNSAIDATLGPLIDGVAEIRNTMNAIQRGIQDTLNSAIMNPLALAGQLQALVKTPLLAINDVLARLDYYGDLAAALFPVQPADDGTTITPSGRNTAAIQQITLTSVISANATIGSTDPKKGALTSQKDAIAAAIKINDQYKAIIDNLDESQTTFEDADIEVQHISQAKTHIDSSTITAQTLEYLFAASFELKQERRFVLDRPRHTIELAISEYKGPGKNDVNIDLFISSNKLDGEDVLWLPAGREVLVYA